jgi:transposase
LTTKIHGLSDALGNPARIVLSAGQRADISHAERVLGELRPKALIADKGYDSDPWRDTLRKHGITSKTYYQWLARYQSGGVEALAPQKKAAENAELVSLRRENERLKRLLADKELALDIKDALLKKTSQRLANAAALPKNL